MSGSFKTASDLPAKDQGRHSDRFLLLGRFLAAVSVLNLILAIFFSFSALILPQTVPLWIFVSNLFLAFAFVPLAFASLRSARALVPEIQELAKNAEQFLDSRYPVRPFSPGEGKFPDLETIAAAMSLMENELERRVRLDFEKSNEREAIFSSLSEAVIAIDSEQKVLNLNKAAAELFSIQFDRVAGRALGEVIRSAELMSLVESVLSSQSHESRELRIEFGKEFSVEAKAAPLRDSKGKTLGVLLAIRDLTQLRRLEKIRKDFVANVSHELRTPVAAIQGSVETLQDGAKDDPAAGPQFLNIIHRQADRLANLLDDLLSLAKIENADEVGKLEKHPVLVKDLLLAAVDCCAPKAKQKEIRIDVDCDNTLTVPVERLMVEQAMVNLLANGIQFSKERGSIQLKAESKGEQVVLSVQDHGSGIASHHFPRLFERFYRADRSRGREDGGAGLGLAIVKHAALAHGGNVSVESRVGEGSTFFLSLPLTATTEELTPPERAPEEL